MPLPIPRPAGRGIIEAAYRVRPCACVTEFRDRPVAASLKRAQLLRVQAAVDQFRDRPVAASLKPSVVSLNVAPYFGIPRPAGRGLIEAIHQPGQRVPVF